jgi:hypothetical protein
MLQVRVSAVSIHVGLASTRTNHVMEDSASLVAIGRSVTKPMLQAIGRRSERLPTQSQRSCLRSNLKDACYLQYNER